MSRYARERMWTVIIFALIICAVLTFLRHQYEKRSRVDPVTDITRRVLFSPVLHGTHSATTWWDTNVVSIFRGPAIAAQNRRLRFQIANLMQQDRNLREEAIENAQLRTLLNFKSRDTRNLLPAEVISLKPFDQRDSALFSRGLNNNVKVKQPALDQNGNLVGQVIDVSSTTSDILLLTDTMSSVGARVVDPSETVITPAPSAVATPSVPGSPQVSRSTPILAAAPATVGICVGDHSDRLQLTDLSLDADVKVGDSVVTSGLGEVYPKDIPIGRIVEVDTDTTRDLKSAIIVPYADFNHLQDGFLIE